MTASTAVSVAQLDEMLGAPADCELPTLEPTHPGCTAICGLPAVGRWLSRHQGDEMELWVCQAHEALILNGKLDFCGDGHMVLWTPA